MATSTTTAPVAQPFSLRIERLSAGKSEALLGQADELEMRIKVYAEGGENELHAHLDHDHSFVVLDGEATFYDAEGSATVMARTVGSCCHTGRSTGSATAARATWCSPRRRRSQAA